MATIIIGRSSSYCGNCGKPCSPHEEGHITNLGWDMKINGTPGCGEPWTHVMLSYYDYKMVMEDQLRSSMLPDHIKALPLI